MNSLVTSNIRQRPLRSTISVIGVALGVALVMLFTGLARGMSNDLQRRSSNLRGEIIFTRKGAIQLTSSSTNLSMKYVDRLRQIEGVAARNAGSPGQVHLRSCQSQTVSRSNCGRETHRSGIARQQRPTNSRCFHQRRKLHPESRYLPTRPGWFGSNYQRSGSDAGD